MLIEFEPSAGRTLGVEWEVALVDQESAQLTSRADQIFELIAGTDHRVHRELLLNTVELVTDVCDTVGEAMADLAESMAVVRSAADDLGIDLFSAGMHPFASWEDQKVTKKERYSELIDRTQWWGRQLLIYGIHVHVGVTSAERVLPVLNSLLRYYPHLQAVSASSPYYDGQDTGYASNRALLFQQLPTAGLPFQFEQWSHYQSYVHDLHTTGVIDEVNEIRWDIRPSPGLGTIEVRICDAMSTFEEVAAVAALIHCLVVHLDERAEAGETLPTLQPWHVQENKWRSARYGMDAIIILNDGNHEGLVREELAALMAELAPVAERLGCASELAGVGRFLDRGADYERQRFIAQASDGDLRAVVRHGVRELSDSFARQLR